MKAINKFKYILFIIAVGFSLSACEEDKVEREDSYVPTGDEVGAYFANDVESSFIVPLSSESVEISIARHDSVNASEVAISIEEPYGNFSIPSTVSFAAGERTTTVLVGFSNLEAFKEYSFFITVSEDETNPYIKDTLGTPKVAVIILQSDYTAYGTGAYTSWWYESTYAVEMEYSPSLDLYRLKDMMADGYHFAFAWDGADEIEPTPAEFETGYIYTGYGMMNAVSISSTYDAATKTFVFTREWTLPSISYSFGPGSDIYVMD